MPQGASGAATFYPGVSAQLKEYYRSVEEEGIPDRFLRLLEKLDMAEKRAEGTSESRAALNER
ncbi:NepR family anti-sigma factor [Peteryoungia desertarenae]|uniref:NepR family anti-sigma factor n=1 Tax=Peteryoungia desertarenae TaxID=1813451 RepID=UPI001107005D|nr:NepR family anti-sigma factor [Peteryoungia desertarenae]